jgi:hypothetical protein
MLGVPLPASAVGHEGSTVIVVLNGLRLLRSQGVEPSGVEQQSTVESRPSTARKREASIGDPH